MPWANAVSGSDRPKAYADDNGCTTVPIGSPIPNLLNAAPIILGLPFVRNRPVKPLDLNVFLQLSWLNIFKSEVTFISPLRIDALMFTGPLSGDDRGKLFPVDIKFLANIG